MENKTISEWAEMLQEQIQAGASKSDIIQILKEYENQALRIHDVVKSFGCVWNFCNAVLDKKGNVKCDKCNRYE